MESPTMPESNQPQDRRSFLFQALAVATAGPLAVGSMTAAARPSAQEEADSFLAQYVKDWLPLDTAASEANWVASMDISDQHMEEQVKKNQILNKFVGKPRVIETTRQLLKRYDLEESTVRQLKEILLRAAEAPGTIPDVVKSRTEAEAQQSKTQDEFEYKLQAVGGTAVTISANDIDGTLVESTVLPVRLGIWETSKTIGAPLRDGLLWLRDLRNKVAREMNFDSFFALQVDDYGMSVPEMVALNDEFLAEVRPLYEQVHTWAKHALSNRYGAKVPGGKIPAHWLTNRWGQNWPGLVKGINLDEPFKGKPREYIVEQAERFYVSLGFAKLPSSFWTKSDLYPADMNRKKNSHASAWHINLAADVRSLMSIEPNSYWFETAHHELGHIFYYLNYSTPKVPYLLRKGANRAFHEGIGDLVTLAASQRSYRRSIGLLPPEVDQVDPVKWDLDTALNGSSVVFLPFSAGVMTHFERDFYEGKIKDDQLNSIWWDLAGKYQGISPPTRRPETLCDPATKTHINDDPGQYYDYAIGSVLKFQLHDHIAREILKQDPRDCNYYGNKKVGEFLKDIFSLGATRDWNTVLKEATGGGLSARPMVKYFEPLMVWLKEQNKGRTIGWS